MSSCTSHAQRLGHDLLGIEQALGGIEFALRRGVADVEIEAGTAVVALGVLELRIPQCDGQFSRLRVDLAVEFVERGLLLFDVRLGGFDLLIRLVQLSLEAGILEGGQLCAAGLP